MPMKKLLLLVLPFLALNSFSQLAADVAVQLSAVAQTAPAQITLNWNGNATTAQYQVYRKLKHANAWGPAIANLSGSTNQFIDNAVTVGVNYEYHIVRVGSGYSGHGYINTGIEVPEISYRGKLILIIDSNFISPLATEISRLVADIEGDGWEVVRHDVLRTGSVTHVKDLIVNDYNSDTAFTTKAVFILGHVPVPYSGNINPDGHSDHLGAWPADCYYGDVDGIWTDNFVTSTTASPPRTQNVPGDGKFDQSIVPSDIELQVGRVDFSGLPSFTLTEQQLLKNYLDKDHEYRKKIFAPQKKAVVDDNFGYFSSEAFAGSGYKNFAPLVGANNIVAADYFTSMTGASYAWSYGCGGGTYTSAGGIGSTSNFATSNLQGVFTMLFGSYFGDWDAQNSFLKAPLAQGKVLTSVWSGRPHFQFHHMGLGENIGYGLLQTQNNPGNLYYASPTSITGRWVHNALMGDPTLKNDIVGPVANVVATKVGYDCHISWSASTETTLVGYNIYMKNDTNSSYVKINVFPIAGTTYTDQCLQYKGVYSYMVRALKLEIVPSGSYYNLSEGIADTAYNSSPVKVYPSFTSVQSANQFTFTNTSSNATSYLWDFGDGQTSSSVNPVVTYTQNGSFQVTLMALNSCEQDTIYSLIYLTEVGIEKFTRKKTIKLFPNPSTGKIHIVSDVKETITLWIYNSAGRQVMEVRNIEDLQLDLSHLSKGIYLIRASAGQNTSVFKLILE